MELIPFAQGAAGAPGKVKKRKKKLQATSRKRQASATIERYKIL